eukprot:evm.model.NODE_21006_length_2992_cov_14.888703.1
MGGERVASGDGLGELGGRGYVAREICAVGRGAVCVAVEAGSRNVLRGLVGSADVLEYVEEYD